MPEVERAMRAVLNHVDGAVRRYAEVSGLPLAHRLPEAFVASFVFDRLGGKYAMTLETNASSLLAHDAMLRGRAGPPDPERAAILKAEMGRLDRTRRVDLVLYHNDSSDRRQQPFLALVEFKLWTKWWKDRP